MIKKQVVFKPKGMNQDLSVSAFNPEFAFENMNLRLSTNEGNTLLSWVNEKGTKPIDSITIDTMPWRSSASTVENVICGQVIGQAVLNHQLVLFTTSSSTEDDYHDRIYVLQLRQDNSGDDAITGKLIYYGNLNFNADYPIETLPLYESTEIQKVYWTDNYNQPRLVNIAANSEVLKLMNKHRIDGSTTDLYTFDFAPAVKLGESVTIDRLSGTGSFLPGVIQYAFTYVNYYGQQSNIFYISPLYYVTMDSRGISPEGEEEPMSVPVNFKIYIEGLDPNFNFARIYSIQRTSINSTPVIKRVVDVPINSTTSSRYINYTDTGMAGETVDSMYLLYAGSKNITAKTMVTKDNTLFLGNIVENTPSVYYLQKAINRLRELDDLSISFNYNKHMDVFSQIDKTYSYDFTLNKSSSAITTFKGGEHYRFGFQLQTKTGEWSEPLFLKDATNNNYPENPIKGTQINLVDASTTLSISELDDIMGAYNIENFFADFVNIRPVIVYPKAEDRKVLYQGVLNPTVFRGSDRYNSDTLTCQPSWFYRPIVEMADASVLNQNTTKEGSIAEYRHYQPLPWYRANIFGWRCEIDGHELVYEDPYTLNSNTDINPQGSVPFSYSNNEFFVDQSILTMDSPDVAFDTEMQNPSREGVKLRIIGMVPITANKSNYNIKVTSNYGGEMYQGGKVRRVNFDQEGCRRAIAGFLWGNTMRGYDGEFIEVLQGSTRTDCFGSNPILAWEDDNLSYWADESWYSAIAEKRTSAWFTVYPWQSNGSLSNAVDNEGSILDTKEMTTQLYSPCTEYHKAIPRVDEFVVYDNIQARDFRSENSESSYTIRLNPQKSYNGASSKTINYIPNVDQVLSINREVKTPVDCMLQIYNAGENKYITQDIYINDSSKLYGKLWSEYTAGTYKGMSKTATTCSTTRTFNNDSIFTALKKALIMVEGKGKRRNVQMQYRSNSHTVIVLHNNGTNSLIPVLPSNTIQDIGEHSTTTYTVNKYEQQSRSDYEQQDDQYRTYWGDIMFFNQPAIKWNFSDNKIYGFLYLGELFTDSTNDFGGTSAEALAANNWLPGGEPVSLYDDNGQLKNSVQLVWDRGDTYYQRYDCLKTAPFTDGSGTSNAKNQNREILSFMCETRVNLDGRYDLMRDPNDDQMLAITPENSNLINPAYSQRDNYFTYKKAIDYQNPNMKHPNYIAYSLTKESGSMVDPFTSVSLASVLELDGDKGEINALEKLNNNIIAFQDTGISQILFNESMQMQTSEGVPIEIANSGKVNGKRYLSNSIGCSNKWSVVNTPSGIYFMDSIGKNICLFNGELKNLSSLHGFNTWAKQNIPDYNKEWNPVTFNNFISYYDKKNQDVMFISKEKTLAFSEKTGTFTSFYSYNKPYFINLDSKALWAYSKNNQVVLHRHQAGEYNSFFDTLQPYWMTLVASPESQLDKIFTNIDLRASVEGEGTIDEAGKYTPLLPFSTVEAWNEYQHGIANLSYRNGVSSGYHHTKDGTAGLARKFRMWRCDIPRDNYEFKTPPVYPENPTPMQRAQYIYQMQLYNQWLEGEKSKGIYRTGKRPNDRMRNPWLYLKLLRQGREEYNHRVEIHDVMMTYYI